MMRRPDQDPDPLRHDRGSHEGIRDLGSQSLLYLQAAGERIHEAGELGKADDATSRNVTDVRDADDVRAMMLAHGDDRDAMHDDHLVCLAILKRLEQLGRVDRIAREPLGPRLDEARGRFREPLAVEILRLDADDMGEEVFEVAFCAHDHSAFTSTASQTASTSATVMRVTEPSWLTFRIRISDRR